MLAMDLFAGDAFGVIPLSELINKVPYIPAQAGSVVPWVENGYPTTTLAIEELAKDIGLVSPSPRGGVGQTFDKEKRSLLRLAMPHFQINDSIMADEVQGVRELGSEQGLMSLQAFLQRRMQDHVQLRLDPTLELAKLGAIKGVVTYADSTTLNLFTTFDVAQPSEVNFDLDTATNGAVRKTCAAVTRTIAGALGGLPFSGVGAICSPEFYDELIGNQEVRASYLQQQEASRLRDGYAYGRFNFGGIDFEEYRGSGSTLTVAADKAHFFPKGVPGLFKVAYAPADYNETVNTNGVPRYAKVRARDDDKGYVLEVQTNPLCYCVRPGALVQGRRT